jgi:hypothetical protein
MHYFPVDIVSEIMEHMSRNDLQNAMLVNKTWHRAFLGCRAFWSTPVLFGTKSDTVDDIVGVMSKTVLGDWLTIESPEPGAAARIIETCAPKYESLTCFSLYDHYEIVRALGCRLLRLGLWLRPETDISSLVHISGLEELDIMFLGSGAMVSMDDIPSKALEYLHLMGVEGIIAWKRFESLKHFTLETSSQIINLGNFPVLETLDIIAKHLSISPSETLVDLELDTKFVHFEDDDRIDRQFPNLKRYKVRGWHCPPVLPPLIESVDIDARNYYYSAGIIDWSGSKSLSSVIVSRLSCDALKLPPSEQCRTVISDVSGEITHRD